MSFSPWTDAEDRVRRARQLIEQERLREAIDELKIAISINPFQADWHVEMGIAFDGLGQPEHAIPAYETALSLEPKNIYAFNQLGLSLHAAGRVREAIEAFDRIEEIDPAFEAAYCNRVRCYTELGEHQAAEENFYAARLYREHCPVCYFNIGQSLAMRGDLDRAIYCWQRTLDLAGEDAAVRCRIALALRYHGRLEQARKEFNLALKASPHDVPTLLDTVSLLVDLRRLDEAEDRLETAERIAGGSPAVSFARATLLLAQGRPIEAGDRLKHTLRLDPTYCGANLALARAAQMQGNLIAAKAYLRAELVLRPDSAGVLFDLANMLIDVDELRLAAACLRRLVQGRPKDVRARQNLAIVESLRGRYDRSIQIGIEALKIDPNNLAVRHNVALSCLLGRRFKDAASHLDIGLRNAPRDRALLRLQLRLRVSRCVNAVRNLLGIKISSDRSRDTMELKG